MLKIGITSEFYKRDVIYKKDAEYIATGFGYISEVLENMSIPLILSQTTNQDIIDGYLDTIDGLILIGGQDVDPASYNSLNEGHSINCSVIRDEFEMKLIKGSLERNIPIFGVCRGLQIINTYFGGTLNQEVANVLEFTFDHSQNLETGNVNHRVDIIKEDSYIKKYLKQDKIMTNSLHHQSVDILGDSLFVTAKSEDGVIEGIESTMDEFIMAVQFHPEMMLLAENQYIKNLVSGFLDEIKKRSEK